MERGEGRRWCRSRSNPNNHLPHNHPVSTKTHQRSMLPKLLEWPSLSSRTTATKFVSSAKTGRASALCLLNQAQNSNAIWPSVSATNPHRNSAKKSVHRSTPKNQVEGEWKRSPSTCAAAKAERNRNSPTKPASARPVRAVREVMWQQHL